jgi:hypothetical protein
MNILLYTTIYFACLVQVSISFYNYYTVVYTLVKMSIIVYTSIYLSYAKMAIYVL